MPRPEEDQPNLDLPAARDLLDQAQHWRVHVPRPKTTLLLGQRVPKGEHEPAVGFPGVSVTTAASFFADVAERTVWQGHETIAFQSGVNAELHGGRAVVLGATGWAPGDADKTAGERLGQTRAQDQLYKQLRDQGIGWAAASQAKGLGNTIKTLVNYPFLDFPGTPLALFGLGLNAASAGFNIYKEVTLGKTDSPAPNPGLYLTSHKDVFVASNMGTSINAATTFGVMAGATVNLHAGATATYSAGIKLEMFANAKVAVGAGYGVDIASLGDVKVISKLKNAKVIGKNVQIGSQTPGVEMFKGKVTLTPFYGRPTQSVKIEALKDITANVVGRFEINSPLGHVSAASRKVTLKATEQIKLDTPLGEIILDATSLRITRASGAKVMMDETGVQVSTTVAIIKIGLEGTIEMRGVGGSIRLSPGGVVSVTGTLVKLG